MGTFSDFACAAAPWAAMGLLLAVFLARSAAYVNSIMLLTGMLSNKLSSSQSRRLGLPFSSIV